MPSKPRPAAVTSLPGPDNITRRVLANGVIVLARENFTSPSVVVDAYAGAGDSASEKTSYAHVKLGNWSLSGPANRPCRLLPSSPS